MLDIVFVFDIHFVALIVGTQTRNRHKKLTDIKHLCLSLGLTQSVWHCFSVLYPLCGLYGTDTNSKSTQIVDWQKTSLCLSFGLTQIVRHCFCVRYPLCGPYVRDTNSKSTQQVYWHKKYVIIVWIYANYSALFLSSMSTLWPLRCGSKLKIYTNISLTKCLCSLFGLPQTGLHCFLYVRYPFYGSYGRDANSKSTQKY